MQSAAHLPTPHNYVPKDWSAYLGASVKKVLQPLVRLARNGDMGGGMPHRRVLLAGSSRSGKTSGVELMIRASTCLNIEPNTLNPCGFCDHCVAPCHHYGNRGWENLARFKSPAGAPTPVECCVRVIDCGRTSSGEIEEVLDEVKFAEERSRIVYLDEFHRLGRSKLDNKLVKAVETVPAIWIATTAYTDERIGDSGNGVERMVLKRFRLLRTERPSKAEFVTWLYARAKEFGVGCERPNEILGRLADRSGRLPGTALPVLAVAWDEPDRRLTMDMVEEHVFDVDEFAE